MIFLHTQLFGHSTIVLSNRDYGRKSMMPLLKKIRAKAKRKARPSYGIVDSQSVKTTSASDERGFDGGKKVKGRKRHITTDIMGNLLSVKVHAANIHDTVAGVDVFKDALSKYPSIKGCAADTGYRGTFARALEELGISVDIIDRIAPKTWSVLPKRWIVERTFAWANNSRRLSKDYEITTKSAENMFMISHLATLLRRF